MRQGRGQAGLGALHLIGTLVFWAGFAHEMLVPKLMVFALLIAWLGLRHGLAGRTWLLSLLPLLDLWRGTHPWDGVMGAVLPMLAVTAVGVGPLPEDERAAIAGSLAVAGPLVSVYLVLQHLGADPFSWTAGAPGSFFGNPNFAAYFLLTSLFLGRFPRDARGFALCGLVLLGMAVSRCRGVWLLSLLWLAWRGGTLEPTRRLLLAGVAVIGLTAALWVFRAEIGPALGYLGNPRAYAAEAAAQPESVDLRDPWFRGKRAGMVTRLILWGNTLGLIADHPMAGVGTGGFRTAYPRYADSWVPDPNLNTVYRVASPHNLVLEAAACWGIPATLLLLGVLVGFWRRLPAGRYRDLCLLQGLAACFSLNYLNPAVVLTAVLLRPGRADASEKTAIPLYGRLAGLTALIWVPVLLLEHRVVRLGHGAPATRLFPEDAARAAFEAGDLQTAYAAQTRALAQDPWGPQTRYHMAVTALARYEAEGAPRFLDEALVRLRECRTRYPYYRSAAELLRRLEARAEDEPRAPAGR